MIRSALRRPRRDLATTGATLACGATIVIAFGSLLDTARGASATSNDRENLVLMASVVGAWGLIVVAFAVASTLATAVRQRAAETALLRSLGATPGQLRALVVVEAAVVAVAATGLAVLPGLLGGRLLLALLQDAGAVGEQVDHRVGPAALGLAAAVTVTSAVGGSRMAVARVARRAGAASTGAPVLTRRRLVAGGIALALATETAVLTMTLMREEGSDAMQTAGQSSVLAAIALAAVAPAVLHLGTRALRGPLEHRGPSGHLALRALERGGTGAGGTLVPIILVCAIATGTISMQLIEEGATAETRTAGDTTVATLNVVVVGMITGFTAIVLVNALRSALAARHRELAQQRLAGATPGEVRAAVLLEHLVLLVTGAVAGTTASLFTVVPYAVARTSSPLAPASVLVGIGVVAVVVALTLVTVVRGVGRQLSRSPIAALTSG